MGLTLRLGPPARQTSRREQLLSFADVVIAVVATGLDVALFTVLSDPPDQVAWVSRTIPPHIVIGIGGLAVLPLLWRRRSPVLVCLILAGHAGFVTVLIGSRPLVSLLVAVYTVAVWSGRARALTCLGAVLAAHAVAVGYEASFTGVSVFAVIAVALVYGVLDAATWAAGRWGASAAGRRRALELEASRAALAADAVEEERLRIARELHDIVAHAVTVMVLQSAGARRVAIKNPHLAAEAMHAVETAGKQATAELRRLLEVLRVSRDGDRDGVPDGAPTTKGQADLDALVRHVRTIGVDVRLEVSGNPRDLDPSVDLTAYRVVQEALTNVNKHAGVGSTAVVALHWRQQSLVIVVLDDGPRDTVVDHGDGGYGLVGLAERVKLVGGQLETGPRVDSSGFALRAVLPIGAAEPAAATPLAVGVR